MVDQGTTSNSDYEVSRKNEDVNWIEITTEVNRDSGSLTRAIKFSSDDRETITHKVDLDNINVSIDRADNEETQAMLELAKSILREEGSKVEEEWAYVDDSTSPE